MSKETKISEYKERIRKAQKEIELCNDRIDELNGLTELCQNCSGKGKIGIRNGTTYIKCSICNGKGKVTK